MKVICNSSPLISLLSIKRIDILEKLFDKIIIPEAVYREVFNSKVGSENLKESRFLEVGKVKDRKFVKLLRMQLDYGESEVIALALEQGMDRVMLDDKPARKIADKLDLKVIGTLGVLVLAKEKQIIKEIRPLILTMMGKINFRISKTVLNRALQTSGEKL